MELDHTSHSAIEEYKKCPQRFYLHRVLKVEQTHHLAGPAGSAFHTMTEDYDNGLQPREYEAYLQEAITEDVVYTHSRGEDYDWWVATGPYLFNQYRKWRDDTGWEVLAVEEEFRIQPDGLQWPVVGFIDRRFRSPRTGTHIICDIKTGYRLPEGSVQLPIYYVADSIRRSAGRVDGGSAEDAGADEQVRAGGEGASLHQTEGRISAAGSGIAGRDDGSPVAVNYYDARRGMSTGLEWPDWDEDALVRYVQPVERSILEEDWTAKPGAQCRYCPVRQHCEFKKGK